MTYKNIPLYLSNKGYGLFINSTGRVEYEIGTEEVNAIKFMFPTGNLIVILFTGQLPRKFWNGTPGFPVGLPLFRSGHWVCGFPPHF
jgi:alpha-D-xyloside xylohydrolase